MSPAWTRIRMYCSSFVHDPFYLPLIGGLDIRLTAPDDEQYIPMKNEYAAGGGSDGGNFDMGLQPGRPYPGGASRENCTLDNVANYKWMESGGIAEYPKYFAPGGTYQPNSWPGGRHAPGKWNISIMDDLAFDTTCIGDVTITYCLLGARVCPVVEVIEDTEP